MSAAEESAPRYKPSELNRVAFQRGEGGVLYADVNYQVMEAIGNTPPESAKMRIGNSALPLRWNKEGKPVHSKSTISLYLATASLIDSYGSFFNHGVDSEDFYRRFGVTYKDLQGVRDYTYLSGFGEMGFPWEFSASLASVCAEQFVEEGYMTDEQYENMTLKDWADIIGTGWFSDLMHDMAYAKNGVHQRQGSDLATYSLGYFKRSYREMSAQPDPEDGDPPSILETGFKYEPYEQQYYAAATLCGEAASYFRQTMQETWETQKRFDRGASHGCPVARAKFVLPAKVVKVNQHVRNILDAGHAYVDYDRSDDEKITIVQPDTPIEVSLMMLAAKLDEYGELYGEPTLEPGATRDSFHLEQELEHVRKPDQNVLSWDLPPEGWPSFSQTA